jgi:hypothetical protein
MLNLELKPILSLTGAIVDERMLKGSDSYDVYYNLSDIHGLYIIQFVAKNVNTSLKLIIGSILYPIRAIHYEYTPKF